MGFCLVWKHMEEERCFQDVEQGSESRLPYSYMLKRKYRLVTWGNKERARVVHTPFFTLRVTQNTTTNTRFGFVVSKKIDRRAVVRNKVKRKIRSCIEEMKASIKPGFDLLFFAKKTAVEEERKTILDRLTIVLRQENLIQ